MRFDLKLAWLQAFVAVAEHGSFTEAGKTIGCDQSTISRHVSNLEVWLGKTLFSCRFPVTLSNEGKPLLPIARQVLDLLKNARSLPTAHQPRIDPSMLKIPKPE